MKKKKMMAYIALGIALAYLAGALIIFSATNSIYAAKFFAMGSEMTEESLDPLYNHDTGETETGKYLNQYIIHMQQMFGEFPYAAAVFDREGNIVAQTGSVLEITDMSHGESEYCFLDKYLTSELKRQIVEFSEENENTYLFCREAEYNIINGEIVPVKLIFEDYNRDSENMLTVTFSDEKAQHKLKNSDGKDEHYFFVDFIDVDESHYNHKAYQELYAMVESGETSEKAAAYCGNLGGSGFRSSKETVWFDSFEVNGEKYCLYQVAERRAVIDTLLSDYFSGYLFSEFILFVIIGAVIMLAANKMYDKNRQLEKTRIAFTGAAAHELKTPLAVISNQCECILEDIAPEKNMEYVSSIYDEAKRMNRLVMSLLQYNRVSTLEKISKEKAELAALVNAEAEKYDSLFNEKNISVENDTEFSEINCNPELISLVIDNFLSNAAKFTPENGEVRISVKKGVLTVFNSGSNIDEENAKHIFEEFYREDKARTSGDNSTGMGLAMCRKILELHGYKYGFRNNGNGVEFYFIAQ